MLKSFAAMLCLLASCAIALADTVVLKDGTSVQGTIIKFGNQYRVKQADGTTKIIPEAEVKQIIKGGTGAAAGSGAAPSAGKPPVTSPPTAAGGASFQATKSKADRVEAPIVAVSIWEKFIDSNAKSPDVPAAKLELEKWQKLQKESAEKINGKWIGGDERKELLKKVDELITQGAKDLQGAQTVQGLKTLEEALKLYPNSFQANFTLGYYYLTKGAIGATGRGNPQYQDKAIKSLEAAARILPTSAATWSNLAIGYNFRNRYVDSVQAAYKAAKIKDDKEIVQNLVNSIAHAPGGMQQNNAKLKPIMEDTVILARKHGIDLRGGNWMYIPPADDDDGKTSPGEEAAPKKAGVAWAGSAFFITEDGYLITNHHVATGDPKSEIQKDISFRIRMDDGTEKNAELIAVDDAADIALMKVKVDSPVPFLKVADANPKQAAKALVLGYPDTGEEDPTMQISEGQVKSLHPGGDWEVWFDLNTTHGNSGGPIVDRSGRVISILTGAHQDAAQNVFYVHGVGPLQIKRFLEKIGDKAPKLEYAAGNDAEFDGEKLTEEARKSTLLVWAIRGAPADAAAPAEKPANSADSTGKEGAAND